MLFAPAYNIWSFIHALTSRLDIIIMLQLAGAQRSLACENPLEHAGACQRTGHFLDDRKRSQFKEQLDNKQILSHIVSSLVKSKEAQ